MMSNRTTDILFLLIKSLEKAEKRHFKLYITRNSGKADLKIVKLFDAIERSTDYDEKLLLKKIPGLTKSRLANLKTHLYKEILSSLRLLKSADSIDLQLTELFDFAHNLYKKGLFLQSLRYIEKAKETAKTHHKYNIISPLLSLEKRIESLHITRHVQYRAETLADEVNSVNLHIDRVGRLSNLSLQLFSWFVQNGHARNEADEQGVKQFFHANLPVDAWQLDGFYEQLYLYQSITWYAFIRQDFIQYYRYSQRWVDLFTQQPSMVRVETGHYIKGIHQLLNAHFVLRNHRGFSKTIRLFESVVTLDRVRQNDNFRIQSFIYLSTARINQHFMIGNFKEGTKRIPDMKKELHQYDLFIDSHHGLVLQYKFAMLYFGSGEYGRCIDHLQPIIHSTTHLRYDLQCYARLLHLIAHYELGNDMLMESLTKSVYRFMSKLQNFTMVEEAMLRFLRRSITLSPRQLVPALTELLDQIKHLETNRFQARAFAYLDVISWLEAKLSGQTLEKVIREKYLGSRHR
jgi:hypothetical protein